jgi:hypothetical protein
MGRATFGEFVQSAHRHLTGTAAPYEARGAGVRRGSSRSLLREVAIMGRYLDDITTTFHNLPAGATRRRTRGPWRAGQPYSRLAKFGMRPSEAGELHVRLKVAGTRRGGQPTSRYGVRNGPGGHLGGA